MRRICKTAEETRSFSLETGRKLVKGEIVAFFGNLGAGKTTFIKGIVEAVGGYPRENVTSPTFSYLNIYETTIPLYHFDLYRLRDSDEFLSMGFEEYLFAGGICCIEWSEKIEELLPEATTRITLSHREDGGRLIEVKRGVHE